ncbi:MAG: phage Gp37/Gp68 family protein [Candidatus Cohnella colombiensis]|uniref:Phage Gp37/Gp68 family protein n=1 Tax=Candidatus Cohnella colombiensis TaxID=3121368 RepID=A0AA95EV20_9BACL|nr:MAG: phage Gp37/Gp68 family protein [Cohnella sp.]
MSDTSIEWTDKVWNPLRGCSKVSEGCRNCYAIKTAHRFAGEGQPFEGLTQNDGAGVNWTGKVMLVPEKLDEPLQWKKPYKIFVNSMSDLFHESVPDKFIAEVFAVMSMANQHTFQLLTKRPEWMSRLLNSQVFWIMVNAHRIARGVSVLRGSGPILLPNVWIGVSVENQKAADERIPLLLQTPAAIRFLSCEPLLGPVDLSGWIFTDGLGNSIESPISWVIAGGESGHGARPMHPEWARSLRDQCQAAGVSFLFKQWGEWLPNAQEYSANPGNFDYERKHILLDDGVPMCKAGKGKAGRKLDGRTWDEFPGELPLPFADEGEESATDHD